MPYGVEEIERIVTLIGRYKPITSTTDVRACSSTRSNWHNHSPGRRSRRCRVPRRARAHRKDRAAAPGAVQRDPGARRRGAGACRTSRATRRRVTWQAAYRSGGADFDDLFMPDVSGNGPSVPSSALRGCAARYAANYRGAKRANVGYRYNGVDVSNFWAAKGSAAGHAHQWSDVRAGYYRANQQTGPRLRHRLPGDLQQRNYSVSRGTRTDPTTITSGTWNAFGGPDAYDVRLIAEDVSGEAAVAWPDTGYRSGNVGASAQRAVSVPSASAQSKEGRGRKSECIIARAGQGDGGTVLRSP